jgi:hypothetical protein
LNPIEAFCLGSWTLRQKPAAAVVYEKAMRVGAVRSTFSSRQAHAALRRAEGAALDGEDVSRAIIDVAVQRGMTGQCPKDRVPIFTRLRLSVSAGVIAVNAR